MEIITKAQAKAAGLRKYFRGVACKRGHIAEQFISGSCVECSALKSKAWYSDHKRAAAKTKKWRDGNLERSLATTRAWREKNRDKTREAWRRYAEKDPEARLQANRDWYWRNVEDQRLRSLEYGKNNPDKRAVVARNRRAKELNGGTHTAEEIADIMKLQRGKCAYCRKKVGKKYHVDHIQPLFRGGTNDRTNLQIACSHCNQTKHAKDPIVFAQSLGMLL